MSADAVVRTATAIDVTTPEDTHDGVLPEPGRGVANVLWIAVVLTLCAAVVALVATIVLLAFVPAEPKAAVDAATIVALLGTVLASLVGFYSARNRR